MTEPATSTADDIGASITGHGMTHEQADAIRSVLFCRTCMVDDLSTVYPQFLQSLGYEV